MIKRIVEISSEPMHLSVRQEQLRLRKADQQERDAASIPCEDIGVLVVEHPRVTFTQSAVATLIANGAAVLFCGRDHLPAAMGLPFSRNCEVVTRLHDQIEADKPTQKRLWKQLVVAKIRAQANNLDPAEPAARKLRTLAAEVRSGDPKNHEAQAARLYWKHWLDGVDLPERFRRDVDGDGVNALLNYGYAILRAGVARALASAGLTPALGIHHCNRANAFALADDLMEPMRPMADHVVRRLAAQGTLQLDRDTKPALLGLLHRTVRFDDQVGPLMVTMHRYVASFLRCLRKEQGRLEIPVDAMEDREGD